MYIMVRRRPYIIMFILSGIRINQMKNQDVFTVGINGSFPTKYKILS